MPRSPRMKKAPKAQNLISSGPSAYTAQAATQDEVKMIKYGNNDKLPHEIIETLCASGTAKRCWRTLDEFLQADGFANVAAAVQVVNTNGETADAILDRISSDYSALDGFSLRVKYTAGGLVGEIYHVAFQTVRKREDGSFLVNPTYGTRGHKRDQDEVLQPYNPAKWKEAIADATEESGSQRGQLLYAYRPTTDAPIYPVPDFWTVAGQLDLESDTQISKSDHKTLRKNFQPPFIAWFPGLNTTAKDEYDKTELDYASEDVADMVNPENEGEPIVLTGTTKEETPQLLPFDNTKGTLSLIEKRDSIGRAVCRHIGVPPVLAGFSTPGQLGNNQEILNSISLLQNKINRKQRVIQRVFSKLFAGKDWTVSTLNILSWLPPEMMATMTEDEKRNFLGLPQIEAPISTEAENTLQALNTLSPLVANKVLESLTEEEIRALIGKGPKANPVTTQPNEDN